MNVRIYPSKAVGTVVAPPSKSMAHRALLGGALTQGSLIENIAPSKDMQATLGCLQRLGALVEWQGPTVRVGGLNPFSARPDVPLNCNESGSTLRFVLPFCLLADQPITLTGSSRLLERPLSVYETIAKEQGLTFERAWGSVTVCGRLKSGRYTVPGNISSQFITGLMFVLPLLEGDSELIITGALESASYVKLTESVLRSFGVSVFPTASGYKIPGNQRYVSTTFRVEGDCSNAAFLDGFNLLDGTVTVTGLLDDTLQGDAVYKKMYQQLMAGHKKFDLSDCPDLGPVMFALSATYGGATFTGTARLRIKESDRVAAMAAELAKFGVQVETEENAVRIGSCGLRAPSVPLIGHNDHRIVMALSLLCSVTGGEIVGAEAVTKSFPDYFEKLKSLQIGLDLYED